MFHGILIDQEFKDPHFINRFKTFAKKQDGSWKIYGVEVEDLSLQETISQIQSNMKSGQPWYAHLYDDEKLIVIFKDKVFTITLTFPAGSRLLITANSLIFLKNNWIFGQIDFKMNLIISKLKNKI